VTTVGDTRALRRWLHGTDGCHLVIRCQEHPDLGAWSHAVPCPGCEHAVVQLATCVGQVSPAVLLELVAGGASGITVALDGCANPCDAEAVIARARLFLSALGRPETLEGALAPPRDRKHGGPWPILGEGAVPVSRRAMLGRRDGPALLEPAERPAERLLAVVAELADGNGLRTRLDAIPTGIPRLTASRCAGSGVCARSCPAGALTLTRTVLAEGNTERGAMAQFQLTFDPGRCTDCGQCLQMCPESALERSGDYLWSSLLQGEQVDLRVGLVRRCARCGMGHGRFGELCAVCAFRVASPFGSVMPPGRPDGTDPAARSTTKPMTGR
jgi:ferredoxin